MKIHPENVGTEVNLFSITVLLELSESEKYKSGMGWVPDILRKQYATPHLGDTRSTTCA